MIEHDTGIEKWAESHNDRPGHQSLPYQPDKYPGQAPEESIVEWRPAKYLSPNLAKLIPSGVMMRLAMRGLERSAGVDAEPILKELQEISKEVNELVDGGKNVAVITPHLELSDIGHALAGLIVACRRPNFYRKNSGIVINKVMAFESHNGKPIVNKSRRIGKVIFAIPSTKSAGRWNIRPDYKKMINDRMGMAILSEIRAKEGKLIAFAPTGSQMQVNENNPNQYIAEYPSPATLGLMERFDAFVLVTIGTSPDGQRNVVVDLIKNDSQRTLTVGKRKRSTTPHFVIGKLAEQVNSVTGREVVFAIGETATEDVVRAMQEAKEQLHREKSGSMQTV